MEKEELALLLQTAAQKGLDMDYLIFLTLSYTGMRAGELVALKWKDIDFEEQPLVSRKRTITQQTIHWSINWCRLRRGNPNEPSWWMKR